MFHEVRMNSYSIDAIFGEDSGTFSQPEIIRLVQCFLKEAISVGRFCHLNHAEWGNGDKGGIGQSRQLAIARINS